MTAVMGGAVMWQMLAQTHMGGAVNANKIMRAELEARGLKYNNKKWDGMSWNDKKKALKKHEVGRVAKECAEDSLEQGGNNVTKGSAAAVNTIDGVVPQSDELKAFLDQQKSIRRRMETLEADNTS